MSWSSNKEKLRCFMVLDDSFAEILTNRAGPAFWCAFVLEDRETGQVKAKFRYKYREPEERNWYEMAPQGRQGEDAVNYLRCALQDVLGIALKTLRPSLSDEEVAHAIECFYPPDDGGDPAKTLLWLDERDLIEIVGYENSEK